MPSPSILESLRYALTAPQAAAAAGTNENRIRVWWSVGCHGVVLKSWMRGGRRVTTREALEEFLLELNSGDAGGSAGSNREQKADDVADRGRAANHKLDAIIGR